MSTTEYTIVRNTTDKFDIETNTRPASYSGIKLLTTDSEGKTCISETIRLSTESLFSLYHLLGKHLSEIDDNKISKINQETNKLS